MAFVPPVERKPGLSMSSLPSLSLTIESGLQMSYLLGNADTQTVRAYERGEATFSGNTSQLNGPKGIWQVSETALLGPDGQRLPRIPGHVAYWFAWDGFLGAKSELYKSSK